MEIRSVINHFFKISWNLNLNLFHHLLNSAHVSAKECRQKILKSSHSSSHALKRMNQDPERIRRSIIAMIKTQQELTCHDVIFAHWWNLKFKPLNPLNWFNQLFFAAYTTFAMISREEKWKNLFSRLCRMKKIKAMMMRRFN